MNDDFSLEFKNLLIWKLRRLKPKRATGVYITSTGITFGFRTNRKKFPDNFVPFNTTIPDFLLASGLKEDMQKEYPFPAADNIKGFKDYYGKIK